MLASRAVRWKFEFSVVRRRRPDAAGRHRAALGCGFEGWLEPVTAEAKVDCLPFRRNEGTTAVRKHRPFVDGSANRPNPTLSCHSAALRRWRLLIEQRTYEKLVGTEREDIPRDADV